MCASAQTCSRTTLRRIVVKPFVWLIRMYQICISPFIGSNCRFYPCCSSYAIEALEKHGVIKGLWLAARRLFKCHPYHAGGVVPVPTSDSRS